MRNRIDLYSRVSVAIVLALLTSQLLVQEVFLGYSPRVRPDLADRLVETTLTLVNFDNYSNIFNRDSGTDYTKALASNENEAIEQLDHVPFQSTVIKGVYAKETGNAYMSRINVHEVDWVTVDYQRKDGSMIKLEIPRGTQPPPPGLF
ncbi:hypothetical protein HY469_02005 [Candidatus Roizmanbacteria bacterium]|nr:hypothetical protein [Candidatus Roizmanbacteria bacterium]